MLEIGEGLKDLWKKFTGQQAAREKAAAEQERLLQEQSAREEAETKRVQLQILADEARKKIQAATHIERVQLPDQDVDFVKEVAEIESQVTARSIFGKFPPTVHMKNIVIHHQGDFMEYGDVDEINFESYALSTTLENTRLDFIPLRVFETLIHQQLIEEQFSKELGKKHFVMVINLPNTEDSLLTYMFTQVWHDEAQRPAALVVMNFKMRREAASRLLELIRKNGDVAEMFLQTGASGFERRSGSRDGIQRVRSNEVILVNFDKFDPDYFNPYLTYARKARHQVASAMLENKNGEIERYRYSTPHGVADPSTIPM